MTTSTITKKRRGPKTIVFTDFPPTTNWKLPALQLAQHLGVCWKVADRLRTAALMAVKNVPVIPEQLELPGFSPTKVGLIGYDCVDWSANLSLLSAHLKLDKREVSRLKLLARRRNRRAAPPHPHETYEDRHTLRQSPPG